MAPGEPRQAPAVWTESRCRIEVVSRCDDFLRGAVVERNADEGIDRFTGRPVIFADGDQPATGRIDDEISVETPAIARDRYRWHVRATTSGCGDPVDTLIAEVREKHDPVRHHVWRTAVLVHARP